MIGGVCAECMDQHIDVCKDHRSLICSSRSLVQLRSMPGNVPPDILEIGNCTRPCRRGPLGLARIILRPSSISEVKVWPFSAACFFALRKSSSGRRTAVRICQAYPIDIYMSTFVFQRTDPVDAGM